MNTPNDIGPAFPCIESDREAWPTRHSYLGMTLRDYFAAKAMQGWLASYSGEDYHPADKGCAASVATLSYAMADAMLAARTPAQPTL